MEWKLTLFLAAPAAVMYVVNLALKAGRTHWKKPAQTLTAHNVQPVR